MEHEGNNDTKCKLRTWNNPQRIDKGTGRMENKRTRSKYLNNSIIKNGQNNMKTCYIVWWRKKEELQNFFIKIYTSFYSFKRGQISVVYWRETDGGRQWQTALLTHNFFSWPQHAVLSSRPHLAFLLLLGRGLNWRLYGPLPRQTLSVSAS